MVNVALRFFNGSISSFSCYFMELSRSMLHESAGEVCCELPCCSSLPWHPHRYPVMSCLWHLFFLPLFISVVVPWFRPYITVALCCETVMLWVFVLPWRALSLLLFPLTLHGHMFCLLDVVLWIAKDEVRHCTVLHCILLQHMLIQFGFGTEYRSTAAAAGAAAAVGLVLLVFWHRGFYCSIAHDFFVRPLNWLHCQPLVCLGTRSSKSRSRSLRRRTTNFFLW